MYVCMYVCMYVYTHKWYLHRVHNSKDAKNSSKDAKIQGMHSAEVAHLACLQANKRLWKCVYKAKSDVRAPQVDVYAALVTVREHVL